MSLKRKNGRLSELMGSPGYSSPLDRIRTGKRERAAQFGIDIRNEASFEANQSFPRIKPNLNKKLKSPEFNLNGRELNSISFLPTFKKQYTNKLELSVMSCNTPNNDSHCLANNGLFDKSWQLYNHFSLSSASEETIQFQQNFINKNPNKALITINGRNSTILTCNDIACDLFDYSEDQLIGMKLKDLLDKNSQYKHDIMVESHLDDTGSIVLCSGKLFDAVDSRGIVIPISMYMQRLTKHNTDDPVCLCIIEPVQRITGYFKINVKVRYS
jgi:PAS domain S-box-containing protein